MNKQAYIVLLVPLQSKNLLPLFQIDQASCIAIVVIILQEKAITEKVSGPSSRLAAAPSDVASSVPGMPYKAIGGLIGTLMEQNAQAFNQI
ncbi:hypothetical protein HN873_043851 [Arachis hypogaea]